MKPTWICDEEGLVCSACGLDVYHCECEEVVKPEDCPKGKAE